MLKAYERIDDKIIFYGFFDGEIEKEMMEGVKYIKFQQINKKPIKKTTG